MIRVRHSLLAGLILVATVACKRDDDRSAPFTGTSAFLDDASPEAREALSIQVDYILTDENFAKWEIAQRNLDRLPRSAFPALRSSTGGNVIDRAVERLESSPKARSTIEATGLSVRDFVLQTIALAQATEAAQGARAAGAGVVPPENFRFVDRHRERIRMAQAASRTARRNADSVDIQLDTGLKAGIDTGIATDAGIDASSSGASEARVESAASETRVEHSDTVQTRRSDSTTARDDGANEPTPRDPSRVPTPRDTTRDSLPLDPRR